ncbi:MAG: formylglycine-generating enzyme family protein [Myxococcota bacterium]
MRSRWRRALLLLLFAGGGSTVACSATDAKDGPADRPTTVATAALLPPRPTGGVASASPRVPPSASAAPSSSTPSRRCEAGEVFIPATPAEGFAMRSTQGTAARPDNREHHRVVLTQPFCMDATEVTVEAYATCVAAKKCEPPRTWGLFATYPKQAQHPVNKADWRHATAYCAFAGKALPTEAQWVWAASGGRGDAWPWGDERPTCEHADFTPGVLRTGASDDGCHGGGPSAVASHPKGAKRWPSGPIHDLAGNVWEWCRDNHTEWSPQAEQVDPIYVTREEAAHVVRGGGWNRSGRGIRIDYRGASPVDYKVPGLGFRCVRNLTPYEPRNYARQRR